METVSLHGPALHCGRNCGVTLLRRPGPVCFAQGGVVVARQELEVTRSDQGVCVAAGHVEIDLVEHLFAALGGLSVYRGVELRIHGREIPLLDGGAADLARALQVLGLPTTPPELKVSRAGRIEIDESVYEFEPGTGREVEVTIDFRSQLGNYGLQEARWDGSPRDFAHRIAPARTFGFNEDRARLEAAGRAQYVNLRSVIVFDSGRQLGDSPAEFDELARHKLLDLIGDLYLFGGPPIGSVKAHRPGHSRSHRALKKALQTGLLRRSTNLVV